MSSMLLTEGPKRYGGIIYAPPAYILAMSLYVRFSAEMSDLTDVKQISVVLFLGGFIALILLFVKPLEWIVFHGGNLKAEMSALRGSSGPTKARVLVRGMYRPRSGYARGFYKSSFYSPYATETRAKVFGAAYLAISLMVLRVTKPTVLSPFLPVWLLDVVIILIVLVLLWSFAEFLDAVNVIKRYYGHQHDARRLGAWATDTTKNSLALTRLAMQKNDWDDAKIELQNLESSLDSDTHNMRSSTRTNV